MKKFLIAAFATALIMASSFDVNASQNYEAIDSWSGDLVEVAMAFAVGWMAYLCLFGKPSRADSFILVVIPLIALFLHYLVK